MTSEALEDNQKYSLLVELFNIIRAFHFIFWFFYCNSHTKQRKVTEMHKMMKWFLPLFGSYVTCMLVEIYFSLTFVYNILKSPEISQEIEKTARTVV